MPEAVIVAAARSPIGRAAKGSLTTMRPDDLAHQMVTAAIKQVPELDGEQVDDLLLGTAQPAGEGGYNMARVVAVLSGLDSTPGTTVNRYCSSSLQTTRMALHAIKAGEGEVFISAGVETVSRFIHGAADEARHHNPLFDAAEQRTAQRALGSDTWSTPAPRATIPTSTSRWVKPQRTSPNSPDQSTRSGRVGRPVTEPRRTSDRLWSLHPRNHPRHPRRWHRGVDRRRATPGHHLRGG